MESIATVLYFFLYPDPQDIYEGILLFSMYGVLLLYVLDVLWDVYRLLKLTFFETFFASRAKPFAVPNQPGSKRILIVGDSTAVGAGASSQADTIAGRLAHDFPGAEIVNLGINGARTKDALRAMNVVNGQQFELTIISVGGNDIWHFTSLDKLKHALRALIHLAKDVSKGPVIVLLYNNIGSSPIFPAFMGSALKRQGELVQTLFRSITLEEGASCIELFSKEEDNPFLSDPKHLFAPDGVHPSSEGYRLWYNRMWRLFVSRGYSF